ncbi:MAG: tetratricopeptide repeat protein [Anaerolineae bacterium]|nr:tetratricopeptide repeat protein [Anaerolineae bacterium]
MTNNANQGDPPHSEGRGIARGLGLKAATGEQYYRRALKNFEAHNLDDALADISEAIYYSRHNPDYYTTRGLFFVEMERRQEAEQDFAYALRLNKRQGLAHFGLGMLRFGEGDYDAAQAHFLEALKAPGARRAEVHFYLAVTRHQLGDDIQALQDIDRALTLFPANDKRLKDARAWRKEIEGQVPDAVKKASKPAKKGKAGKKDTAEIESGAPPAKADKKNTASKLPPGRS